MVCKIVACAEHLLHSLTVEHLSVRKFTSKTKFYFIECRQTLKGIQVAQFSQFKWSKAKRFFDLQTILANQKFLLGYVTRHRTELVDVTLACRAYYFDQALRAAQFPMPDR